MQNKINKINNGVNIKFSGNVVKQNIVTMVENCQTGQCECMSDETKKKIEGMEVTGEDGSVSLSLSGNITKEEIEAAVSKSKVLNPNT